MNHLDLFSGIGGFSLAASWVWKEAHNIVSFVEIDPFCQKVLNKHWPDVPIHDDIRSYKHDGTTIHLLTGGFPCQPFSTAGKQEGKKDDRYLWPKMLRIISEVRPTWIIGENVAGIINLALDQVLSDLENESYTCQPFIIPACGVNALHRRDRVWIVANLDNSRNSSRSRQLSKDTDGIQKKPLDNRKSWNKFEGCDSSDIKQRYEFRNSGKNNGIPCGVVEFKALGNAIVPQVVVPIMEAIKRLSPNKASAEAHE